MHERSALNRFLGGSPLAVLVRLALISLLVGGLMAVMGWQPVDIIYGAADFARGIWNLGFGAVEALGQYFLLGAVVVVPVFLIMRLLSTGRR
ncbi:MAG: DUF6460 domain-containing protein [Pseudomonadota bacterium]